MSVRRGVDLVNFRTRKLLHRKLTRDKNTRNLLISKREYRQWRITVLENIDHRTAFV